MKVCSNRTDLFYSWLMHLYQKENGYESFRKSMTDRWEWPVLLDTIFANLLDEE